MKHFREENGKYTFTSTSSQKFRRIFSIAMAFAVILPIAIVAILYFLVPEDSFSGTDRYAVVIVLLVMVPVELMIMLFVRKRVVGASTMELDYMQGRLSYGSGSGRRELGTGEVRKVVVSGTGSTYGMGNLASRFTIKLLTDSGEVSTISLRYRDKALEVAGELASLLSADLRDETGIDY